MVFNLPSNGLMVVKEVGIPKGITLGQKKKMLSYFSVADLNGFLSVISELVHVDSELILGDLSFPDIETILYYLLRMSGYEEVPYNHVCECGHTTDFMLKLSGESIILEVDILENPIEESELFTSEGHVLYFRVPKAREVFVILEPIFKKALSNNSLSSDDMVNCLFDLVYICVADKNGEIPHKDIVDDLSAKDSKRLLEWVSRVTVSGCPNLKFNATCRGCSVVKPIIFPINIFNFVSAI